MCSFSSSSAGNTNSSNLLVKYGISVGDRIASFHKYKLVLANGLHGYIETNGLLIICHEGCLEITVYVDNLPMGQLAYGPSLVTCMSDTDQPGHRLYLMGNLKLIANPLIDNSFLIL